MMDEDTREPVSAHWPSRRTIALLDRPPDLVRPHAEQPRATRQHPVRLRAMMLQLVQRALEAELNARERGAILPRHAVAESECYRHREECHRKQRAEHDHDPGARHAGTGQ